MWGKGTSKIALGVEDNGEFVSVSELIFGLHISSVVEKGDRHSTSAARARAHTTDHAIHVASES
jgi:hypothetical protein